MSQENVEIVRQSFLAISRGDLDAAFALANPDVEFDVSRTNPEGRVYRGREEVLGILEEWTAPYDEYVLEPLQFIDAPPDKVVVVIRERGRIKGSEFWTEQHRGAVCTLRGAKLVRYEEHPDKDQALEAAGLSE